MNSKLTFENVYAGVLRDKSRGVRGCGIPIFSKVSFSVVLYGKLNHELTFENVYLGVLRNKSQGLRGCGIPMFSKVSF